MCIYKCGWWSTVGRLRKNNRPCGSRFGCLYFDICWDAAIYFWTGKKSKVILRRDKRVPAHKTSHVPHAITKKMTPVPHVIPGSMFFTTCSTNGLLLLRAWAPHERTVRGAQPLPLAPWWEGEPRKDLGFKEFAFSSAGSFWFQKQLHCT